MYHKIILAIFLSGFSLVINAQLPGDLDISYGENGIHRIPFGTSNSFSQSIIIQPDGKAVVAVLASNGSNNDFTLLRLDPDGEPDPGFGDEGIVFTDFDGRTDSPQDIAIDSSSRLIVTGYVDNGTGLDFGVARYLPDGSPDLSFGEQGLVTTTIGISAFAESVTVQKDQKIIVGGYAFNHVTSENQFTMVRYLENGKPDSSFHQDGIVMTDMDLGGSVANAVLIQDDGRILLAGQVFNEADFTFVVGIARYLENGQLDNSWDEDGIAFYSTPGTLHTITSIALDGEGRVVVGGYSGTAPSNTVYTIARFLPDGTADDSFGGDGMINHSFGGQDNQITSVVLQPDGKILAGGSSMIGNEVHFAVARFQEGGNPDSTFGENGIVLTELGMFAGIKSVVLQSDGKLLVAGESFDGNIFAVTVARYITGLSTSIDPVIENMNILIYPNPVHERLYVAFELLQPANIHFELFDLTGRLLHAYRGERAVAGSFQKALDIPVGLHSGVYLLRITVDGVVTGRMVMIQ